MATEAREREMRKFKSVSQAKRFLGSHAAVSNLFNLARHLVGAQHYRDPRVSASEVAWCSNIATATLAEDKCYDQAKHLDLWLLPSLPAANEQHSRQSVDSQSGVSIAYCGVYMECWF